MIRLTNMGTQIHGDHAMTSAELTYLLNKFYTSFDDADEALESMQRIAENATTAPPVPMFSGLVDIDISLVSGARITGSKADVEIAITIITAVMYKDEVSHVGEDDAKKWLAFIGRLAVMTDDDIEGLVSDILN